MYKTFRKMRIAVSVLFIVVLSIIIIDANLGVTPLGSFLVKMQLVPAILTGSAIWIVFWVVLTMLFGRIYCSSVCPLGTLQDVASGAGRRLSKGENGRYRYEPPFNVLRFSIPVIVAGFFFLGITEVVESTDPFTIYSKILLSVVRPTAIGLISVAASALFFVAMSWIAWRRGRLICNTVCPAGGLLGLLSRNPVMKIDINTDKCIHCGKCEDVCKSSCIDLTDCTVDNSRCVMCFNCTAICPNDAIVLRKGNYRLSTPMMETAMQCHTPISHHECNHCIKHHSIENKNNKS